MQNDNRETEIEVDEKVYATEEQYLEQIKRIKKKLISDRDLLYTIKELILMKPFTYNEDIIKGLDLIIWQLLVEHLSNENKIQRFDELGKRIFGE